MKNRFFSIVAIVCFTTYTHAQKVFSVDYDSQIGVKVFLVKYENQAGWRNNSKRFLMY